MDKKIHLISGLPRSGSTLLCNILNQNPKFHATATSGLLEILFQARNQFNQIDAFNAMNEEDMHRKCLNVLRGMVSGFYADVEKPVVFDKSRGWEAYAEMADAIFGARPKIICCVRDLREVLASLERVTLKTSAITQIRDERRALPGGTTNYFNYQTIGGRCNDRLSQEGGVLGLPIVRIKDAVQRGWKVHKDDQRGDILFVEFEKLTSKPKQALQDVYEFIDEEYFAHDFVNVEQTTFENDLVHGFKGLHKIEATVSSRETTWQHILPKQIADGLKPEAAFWRNL